jgi:hypothetical protein
MVQSTNEYTRIRIPGCELSNEIGAPEVPVRSIMLALPYGVIIKDINVTATKTVESMVASPIAYVRKPVILSQRGIFPVDRRSDAIYESDNAYPSRIVELKGVTAYDNQTVCELQVYPVQCYPKSKRLLYHTMIRIAIKYEGGVPKPATNDFVRKFVDNPTDITVSAVHSERANCPYLIITNPPMDTIFQRLADWKTKKGIRAEIRTVNWILAHYPGEDNAAQIRNYLKTMVDSSTSYVLLAGDVDVIPCRFAYAMTCSAGYYPGREDTMPCDLYYADLQGSWDRDGDWSYGEIEDSIDLYPDLFVGRAPVNTISEAQKFVEKILQYEKNPDPTYLDNAVFAADILWSNPYTDQGVHKNKIADESMPPWFTITKLYRSQGNLSPGAILNALRQGQGIFNHDGHGWIDVIGAGTGNLHNIDFDTLTSQPYYGICYSIGCWTAAFDSNSIAEAFVNSPHGGGVAYVGNSSYGWGSPGNPGFGYSDRFDSRFFYSLFVEGNYRISEALALCKIHFIPYSREPNVYRWHQYQLNLLGDPELPIWTALPETLAVFHPQTIPVGNSQVLVTVKNNTTNAPAGDALVCLMKKGESYASGRTDPSGTVFLSTTPSTTGNIDLTVTAHNYIPNEAVIPVVSGPYVNYRGWTINDSLGNDDGRVNPGEDIFLDVIIKNTGNATSNNIQLVLRSSDPLLTVQDSIASFASLNPNDSACLANAFRVTVGSAANGHGISCDLEITDNSRTLNYAPTLLVGTPVFQPGELIVAQPPTMPGDIETLSVKLTNVGYGIAHAPLLTVGSLSPYVTILDDIAFGPDLMPDSAAVIGPLVVQVLSGCPPGTHPDLNFSVTAETYLDTFSMHLIVGVTGFSDDMESGTGLWTTGGVNNGWQINTYRSYSPAHAWYCGDSITHQYTNNMNCYIQTVQFMIGYNSTLEFYRWFKVPLYGSDGIYVIVMHQGTADTLDFIGTGGALQERGIQSEWFQERYALDRYAAGDTIQVRIAFFSDSDNKISEGFYIDDVAIRNIAMIQEYGGQAPEQTFLRLEPNPCARCLRIMIQFNRSPPMTDMPSLKIFDSAGRIVKTLAITGLISTQPCVMTWDGTDDHNRRVPAGIYFVSLEAGGHCVTGKAVLVR